MCGSWGHRPLYFSAICSYTDPLFILNNCYILCNLSQIHFSRTFNENQFDNKMFTCIYKFTGFINREMISSQSRIRDRDRRGGLERVLIWDFVIFLGAVVDFDHLWYIQILRVNYVESRGLSISQIVCGSLSLLYRVLLFVCQ